MVHIYDSSFARRKTYLPKASFIEGPTAAAAVEGNVVSSFWFRFKNGGNVSAGTGNCSTPPLRLDSSSSSSRAQKEVSSGATTPPPSTRKILKIISWWVLCERESYLKEVYALQCTFHIRKCISKIAFVCNEPKMVLKAILCDAQRCNTLVNKARNRLLAPGNAKCNDIEVW